MITPHPTVHAGFAARCDLDGTILEVLHDDLGLAALRHGESICGILDDDSLPKARGFLRAILERRAAFGWEMNIRVAGGIEALHLGGVQIHDGIILTGARTPADVAALCEQFTSINNDQANALRSIYKERVQGGAAAADHALYGEMSQLNSELANLQREMAREQSALERANRELAQRAAELDALHRATAGLLTTLDVDQLLDRALAATLELLPEMAAAALVLPGQAPAVSSRSRTARAALNDAQLSAIAGAVQRRGEILASVEVGGEVVVGAPLMRESGPFGALLVVAAQELALEAVQEKLFQAFAAMVSATLDNALLHREVERAAVMDALSGVYNRRGFLEHAERKFVRARSDQRPLAALMLDIDHFKRCNDEHGHAAGDQVIVEVAKRFAAALRPDDILGRFGGEEFAAVLSECTIEDAAAIGERVRKAMSVAIATTDGELVVTASIGAAALEGGMKRLDQLLARADDALYEAKKGGRDAVRVWGG